MRGFVFGHCLYYYRRVEVSELLLCEKAQRRKYERHDNYFLHFVFVFLVSFCSYQRAKIRKRRAQGQIKLQILLFLPCRHALFLFKREGVSWRRIPIWRAPRSICLFWARRILCLCRRRGRESVCSPWSAKCPLWRCIFRPEWVSRGFRVFEQFAVGREVFALQFGGFLFLVHYGLLVGFFLLGREEHYFVLVVLYSVCASFCMASTSACHFFDCWLSCSLARS